jgi:chain length determinant protein tyrosine kinase EpsG
MAKFRASAMQDLEAVDATPVRRETETVGDVLDRPIGAIIAESRHLSSEDVARVLAHQRETGKRFGEAAVALGLATTDDVLSALAKQFHYPYAPEERRGLNPELVTFNQPFSTQAEAFRAIRSQLTMRVWGENSQRRALAVVSPNTGDGKTFFAANLAIALAQMGGRTLLVDADLRGPRLHQVFGLGNETGLSGILSGRGDAQVVHQVHGIPGLFVLPVGIMPPNPLELLERPAFGLLMRDFAAKFDHVIVDTPAMIYGTDATVVAARCGSALVIARKDASRIGALQDLVAVLANGPAKIAGVIMNEF